MGEANKKSARACSSETNKQKAKNVRAPGNRKSHISHISHISHMQKSGLAAVARQDNARALNREKQGQSISRAARWTRAAARLAYDHRVAVTGTTILGGAALLYTTTQGEEGRSKCRDARCHTGSGSRCRRSASRSTSRSGSRSCSRSRCSRFRRPSRCSRRSRSPSYAAAPASRSRSRCSRRSRRSGTNPSRAAGFIHAICY